MSILLRSDWSRWSLLCMTFALSVLVLPTPSLGYVLKRTQTGIPLVWTSTPISYYVGKAGSQSLPDDVEAQIIQQAFQVWSNVDCARLTFRYEGLIDNPRIASSLTGNNQNHVLWVRSPANWPFPSNAIAVTKLTWVEETGALQDADIAFRDFDIKWSTEEIPKAGHHDLLNTAVHEVGHLLGLEHTPVSSATMYAEAPEEETQKRDLASDDREGICFLYPLNPSPLTWSVVTTNLNKTICPESSSDSQEPLQQGCQVRSNPTDGTGWIWTLLIFLSLWYSCSFLYHQRQRT